MAHLDLHMHSHYSLDGEYSPARLLDLAVHADVKVMALTDHNTMAGFAELIEANRDVDLQMIPGIEIDASYEGRIYHILGYHLDWEDQRLTRLTSSIYEIQIQLVREVVWALQERGFDLTYDDVLKYSNKESVPGFSTIAKASFQGKRTHKNQYLDFMREHIVPITPHSYVENLPSVSDVIDLLNVLGGIPVLAHPGYYINLENAKEQQVFKTFVEMGLQGVEAFSTYHSQKVNNEFLNLGLRHDLFITQGSDFHGELKPAVSMGGVPETDFPVLEALRTKGFFEQRHA